MHFFQGPKPKAKIGVNVYPGVLLAVAASGMRRGDPGCQVIGGIAGPPGALTREVIEAGCLKHVDIFNVHCYLGTGRPETLIPQMDTLLSLMDRHGGRKPIWVTEFAYYATDDLPCRPFFPEKWSWATLLDSERKCAEYTVRFFTIMLGRGVTKVFLHAGSNEAANEWGFECPLFAYGGVPRQVYPALAVFTHLMGPKPVFAGESSFDKDGHCFAFETGDRAALVLWRENECVAETVTVPAAGVECLDIMGNTIAARSIPLATSPVYLLGAAGRAKEVLDSLAKVAPR